MFGFYPFAGAPFADVGEGVVNTSITPAVGTLTLAGVAPIATIGISVTPAVGSLVLAGAAPTAAQAV